MKQRLKKLSILILAIVSLATFSQPTQAQGGSPMMTDDPATPGDGMWEINFVTSLGRSRAGWNFDVPNVDVNFGFGNDIQFKFEAPLLISKENGEPTKVGLGNSMVGVKWRFLDAERSGFDMSTYPQVEFNNPTRSAERGLVDKGTSLFLPLEVGKQIGPVEMVGEVGYKIVQYGPNEWEYGVLLARKVAPRIELMGEAHGSTPGGFGDDELFVNVGSRIQVSKKTVLFFSAGRAIRNHRNDEPRTIATLGIQFNFRNRMPGFLRHYTATSAR